MIEGIDFMIGTSKSSLLYVLDRFSGLDRAQTQSVGVSFVMQSSYSTTDRSRLRLYIMLRQRKPKVYARAVVDLQLSSLFLRLKFAGFI